MQSTFVSHKTQLDAPFRGKGAGCESLAPPRFRWGSGHATYYGGLKFVPLGYKRLVILQSIHKVKLNLLSCFIRVRFAKQEHDEKFNFTL